MSQEPDRALCPTVPLTNPSTIDLSLGSTSRRNKRKSHDIPNSPSHPFPDGLSEEEKQKLERRRKRNRDSSRRRRREQTYYVDKLHETCEELRRANEHLRKEIRDLRTECTSLRVQLACHEPVCPMAVPLTVTLGLLTAPHDPVPEPSHFDSSHLPHRMNLRFHFAPVPTSFFFPPLLPIRKNFAPSSADPTTSHLYSPYYSTLRGFPLPTLLFVPPLLPMRRNFWPSFVPHPLPFVIPFSLFCALLPSRVPPHRRGRFTLSFVLLARLSFLPHLPTSGSGAGGALCSSYRGSRTGFLVFGPDLLRLPWIFSLRSGGFQVTGDP
uniref:MEQ protein n=1 Tax=Gallid alphaherpesvirus 2 TaxID=10390 RepID=C0KLZ4_9ALPH|nr:MEQ protein [Gallid alphaherpesvirus 2]